MPDMAKHSGVYRQNTKRYYMIYMCVCVCVCVCVFTQIFGTTKYK
ncbi:hypothetical protein HMPREF9442_01770 [Paraprevotella xylaniphila YIT 11841]|uniref:Uncharacterized protein n=1 Tax=Paraprevotella xylaniphila YIT 11841 TaxID=762982 RepID=F3QU98_9BACT|nr:hypothetical protein HMPREF9442_01770 [Paraprevotella xylaniphila YIT 11841]